MHQIVVEHLYDPPLTEVEMSAEFERLLPLLKTHDFRRLRSWVADDGERGLDEFEGPDVQTLADLYQRAKVPFVRMWSGTLLEFRAVAEPAVESEGNYEELAGP
ncbi:MAG: hypothetical protein H6Q89_1927 [Myxococcaceae bacterium]|nr:hypothetical protein [Myxococcaceae bacterium]